MALILPPLQEARSNRGTSAESTRYTAQQRLDKNLACESRKSKARVRKTSPAGVDRKEPKVHPESQHDPTSEVKAMTPVNSPMAASSAPV